MKSIRGLVALFALAACGGSGTSAGPVTPTPPAPDPTPPAPTPVAAPDPQPPELRLGDDATPALYILDITLDPNKDTFSGVARINVDVRKPTTSLWLHGGELTIASASMKTAAGEVVPGHRLATSDDDFLGLGFASEIPAGRHWLEIAYSGKVADNDYSGIFRQKVGEDWYAFTQHEATSARKSFPCFDEPRFKVPWTLSLHVPDGMMALSNTPVKREMPDKTPGTHAVVFETTPALPSYLIAFAVGPFEAVDAGTAGRNKTPVRIIVTKGRAAEAAYTRKSVIAIQEALESYFDMPYPFAKMDHITVPRFLGAMENPGLITYQSELLLAPPGKETPGWQRRSASVIAHEFAHQWFGDLVTLAWWDDTWLNESFATWASFHAVDAWKPGWQTLIDAAEERGQVFGADSLMTARKVRNPITTKHDIASAFDGITYGKGAAVLWMFERAIGPDKFRDGVRAYLRAHAGKTATAADFFAAIGQVSKPEMVKAFESFIDQPGVPMVSVGLRCDAGAPPALTLAQERFVPTGAEGGERPVWSIPLCFRHGDGKRSAVQCTLFDQPQATIPIDGAARCPSWVMANADAAGYYRVSYQGDLLDRLIKAGGAVSELERLTLANDLDAALDSGRASAGDVLRAAAVLARDKSPRVLTQAAGLVGAMADPLIPDDQLPAYARFVRKTFGAQARKLGWTPRKGESDATADARRAVVSLVAERGEDAGLRKQARAMADRWLAKHTGIEDETLGTVLAAAARDGDAALYDRLLAAVDATKEARERRALLGALGSFTAWPLAQRSLELYLARDFDPREGMALLFGAFSHPANRDRAYQFVKDNVQAILAKIPFMARPYISGAMLAFCDQAHLDDARAFFAPIVKDMLGGTKSLEQNAERVSQCISRRAAQQPGVVEFLGKQ